MVLFGLTPTLSYFLRERSGVAQAVIYSSGDQERQSPAAQSFCWWQAMVAAPPAVLALQCPGGEEAPCPQGPSTALPECAACTACLRI